MTAELSGRVQATRALEAEFSELLMQVRRITTQTAHRVHPDLLPGTYKVLSTIAHHTQLTVSQLTELMLVDKGHLSRAVSELESLSLVDRVADPTDRRSSLIHLTAFGTERVAEARAAIYNPLSETLTRWDQPAISRLAMFLHTLTNAGTPSEPSEPAADRDGAIQRLQFEFNALLSHTRRLFAETAELVQPGMAVGTYFVFARIVRSGAITAREIAETLMLDKAYVSRSVKELIAAGFIAATIDETDRRLRTLSPTDLGRARLGRGRSPLRNRFKQALDGWTPAHIRAFELLLRSLREGVLPAPH